MLIQAPPDRTRSAAEERARLLVCRTKAVVLWQSHCETVKARSHVAVHDCVECGSDAIVSGVEEVDARQPDHLGLLSLRILLHG
jgi:hypothetical protein